MVVAFVYNILVPFFFGLPLLLRNDIVLLVHLLSLLRDFVDILSLFRPVKLVDNFRGSVVLSLLLMLEPLQTSQLFFCVEGIMVFLGRQQIHFFGNRQGLRFLQHFLFLPPYRLEVEFIWVFIITSNQILDWIVRGVDG